MSVMPLYRETADCTHSFKMRLVDDYIQLREGKPCDLLIRTEGLVKSTSLCLLPLSPHELPRLSPNCPQGREYILSQYRSWFISSFQPVQLSMTEGGQSLVTRQKQLPPANWKTQDSWVREKRFYLQWICSQQISTMVMFHAPLYLGEIQVDLL